MSAEPLQRALGAGAERVDRLPLARIDPRAGTCSSLIDDYSVVGATSNPTIFQKAMTARGCL